MRWKWQFENSEILLSSAVLFFKAIPENKKKQGTCKPLQDYFSGYSVNMIQTTYYCARLIMKFLVSKWKSSVCAMHCNVFKTIASSSCFHNNSHLSPSLLLLMVLVAIIFRPKNWKIAFCVCKISWTSPSIEPIRFFDIFVIGYSIPVFHYHPRLYRQQLF